MTTDEHQLADRLVSIVVVVFFIKAAGVVHCWPRRPSAPPPAGRGVPVAVLLAAGLVAAAVDLLRNQRWAWPLALAVLVLDAVLVPGILRWLIDFGLAIVLTRRLVRAKFGVR